MSFSVGRIDFINTVPVYYGIDTGRVICPGRTVTAPPSRLNRLLGDKTLQISAISSVAYALAYPDWLILPQLSISARGPVGSVLLCLKGLPRIDQRITVGLSDKSATSKALTRILLEDHHRTLPSYEEVDFSKGVPKGLDGVLIIGDDALRLEYRETYPHILDLATFWVDWTGLPFVFGLWAVEKKFARDYPVETEGVARALIRSKEMGKKEMAKAACLAAKRTGVSEGACRTYLEHIEYDLDEEHRQGLIHFYRILKARGELDREIEPVFWNGAQRESCFGE